LKLRDQVRVADAVTEAQAGQAIDLGEGPHQEQVGFAAAANLGQQVQRLVKELDVGFVQGDQHVLGHGIYKPRQVFPAGARPGRVVRVGDNDDPRVRRDGGQHRVEVVAIVPRGYDN